MFKYVKIIDYSPFPEKNCKCLENWLVKENHFKFHSFIR